MLLTETVCFERFEVISPLFSTFCLFHKLVWKYYSYYLDVSTYYILLALTSSGNNDHLMHNVNDNMGSDALLFIQLNFLQTKLKHKLCLNVNYLCWGL